MRTFASEELVKQGFAACKCFLEDLFVLLLALVGGRRGKFGSLTVGKFEERTLQT